jgi:hypothetical protein
MRLDHNVRRAGLGPDSQVFVGTIFQPSELSGENEIADPGGEGNDAVFSSSLDLVAQPRLCGGESEQADECHPLPVSRRSNCLKC